jgi:pimeloyl-ACP methyl ester carboxylesterase
MDIVLVPGAWLNGSSWVAVSHILNRAGHRVRALTLPGMGSRESDRSTVTARDHVNAIVSAIDEADGPVLLVGHSVGAGLASAAVDARPDKVARAVYVGGFPIANGSALLPDLKAENGEVAMPDWVEIGEESNIVDFDAQALVRFYANAIPAPERVLTDMLDLSDEHRYDVPVTAICPEYTAAQLREWIVAGEESVAEFTKMKDVEYIDLPGGHWPQLTQPEALAQLILAVADHPTEAPAATTAG